MVKPASSLSHHDQGQTKQYHALYTLNTFCHCPFHTSFHQTLPYPSLPSDLFFPFLLNEFSEFIPGHSSHNSRKIFWLPQFTMIFSLVRFPVIIINKYVLSVYHMKDTYSRPCIYKEAEDPMLKLREIYVYLES